MFPWSWRVSLCSPTRPRVDRERSRDRLFWFAQGTCFIWIIFCSIHLLIWKIAYVEERIAPDTQLSIDRALRFSDYMSHFWLSSLVDERWNNFNIILDNMIKSVKYHYQTYLFAVWLHTICNHSINSIISSLIMFFRPYSSIPKRNRHFQFLNLFSNYGVQLHSKSPGFVVYRVD